MSPDPARLRRYITEFNFKPLFVEELGWDNVRTAPLTVQAGDQTFTLTALAQKRGLLLLLCPALPPYAVRRRIDREVTKVHREHLLVFAAPDRSAQVWLWVRREPGKPAASRERHYHRGETGERVAQTLAQISFSLEEEEELTLFGSISRVKAAFDLDRVTKKFYERFKKEHATFLTFIHGIPDDGFHRWYASVMLNRLMFIYFVQRKGFMAGDLNYLGMRLTEAEQAGRNYYRDFLRVLFFQGFAVREQQRSAEINQRLGSVPYLNGGLFAMHTVEETYGDSIEIENAAFARLFAFFGDYNWHLDERPLRNDKEINPDVLGYIFEKYINQKQMGAYYTKEDITDYIGKNTILPYLLDAVRREQPAAFDAGADLQVMLGQRRAEDAPTVWRLLAEDPDRYIYPAVRHGVSLELPAAIAAGIDDVGRRTEWNRSAPPDYALPTEIWREVVARRQRYAEVRAKLERGAVTRSDDLITLNLNIRQFARDVIDTCEDPALLRAFWQALLAIAVLDPTGGSGAFLFAALTILEDLYDACLDRMEWFVDERPSDGRLSDFRATLAEVARHPNRRYFILKSIIVHNLYAVDIMEEAVEICKLRLFLKLVAQVERAERIEPLPDIDFNIRAGNTLVGFVSRGDVRAALELEQTGGGAAQGKLIFGEEQSALDRIEEKAREIDRAFASFRALQTQMDAPADAVGEAKAGLKAKLRTLEDELNRLLARVYGVKVEQEAEYRRWQASHKPFHWFVEFYGVLQKGGFDAIVGNPPYVEYRIVRAQYGLTGFHSSACNNLYGYAMERSTYLVSNDGRFGMIVPAGVMGLDDSADLRQVLIRAFPRQFLSTYAIRPSKLFDGVDQRLCIFLGAVDRRDKAAAIYASRYHHWHAEEREHLFEQLSYDKSLVFAHLNRIAQVGDGIARSILDRLAEKQATVVAGYFVNEGHNSFLLHYHRSPRYWIRAMDFEQYFKSATRTRSIHHFRDLHMRNARDGKVVGAILNSSLFFYWFVTLGNGRNLTGVDVAQFPVGDILDSQMDVLPEVFDRLMLDYQRNSVVRVRTDCEYQEFRPSLSKPVIDEIDRVLARHYGFTDEELDYIINYDIKYRLGAEDADGEEE
jgi:hypothetical protein